MPTNEKASPVKRIIGNIMRESVAASAVASGEKSGAMKRTSGSENKMPPTAISVQIVKISPMKRLAKSIASLRLFFCRMSLKMGIKLAEMTPPITRSKSVMGSWVAAI